MAHMTGTDIVSDVRELVNDTEEATWTDAYFLVMLKQGISYIRKAISKMNPDILVSTVDITTVDGTDSYDLPTDFLYPLSISRGRGYEPLGIANPDCKLENLTGEPTAYYITSYYEESVQFGQITFDITPGSTVFTYTMRYVTTASVTALSDAIPLPTFCREPLVDWLVKWALNRDEYVTTTEDQKLAMVFELLGGIVQLRSNSMEVELQ